MIQLPTRSTLAEWRTVESENPIFAALKVVEKNINAVVAGEQKLALIFAPDSVGAEDIFEQARSSFTRAGKKPVLPGADVASKMLGHFGEASGHRPIMIKEAKGALANEAALQLIASALDPLGDPLRRVGTGRSKRTINLRVPMVLMTTASQGELPQVSRDLLQKVIYKHQTCVAVPAHLPKVWEYLVYQALFTDLLVPETLSGDDLTEAIRAANFAITAFTENQWNLAVIGRETLVKLAQFSRANPSMRSLPQASAHPELGPLFNPPGTHLPVGAQPDWASLIRERFTRR